MQEPRPPRKPKLACHQPHQLRPNCLHDPGEFFRGYLNSNLAREIAHLTGWTDKIWSRRYEAIHVSDEIEAQVDRMKYLLANGTKEGLVEHPQEWPGVHCASLLLSGGDQAKGVWHNRTRQYALRRTRKTYTEEDYTNPETVQLTPLPCWKHLAPRDYCNQIQGLVELIVNETRAERIQTDKGVLGLPGGGAKARARNQAREAEEISSARFPCLQEKRPQGSLRKPFSIPGRVPDRLGKTARRGQDGKLPNGMLPSGTALRRCGKSVRP